MLIKENSLIKQSNILDKLNEAVYLDESEATTQPVTIPVREMSRFGEGYTMVRFADVERLAEDSQVSYMDAVAAIAEASEVDVDKMTIAVDEATIIESPEVLGELANVVVAPISDNDAVYQFCEAVTDAYLESGDESILEAVLDEGTIADIKDAVKWSAKATKKSYQTHGVKAPYYNFKANTKADIRSIKGLYDKFKDRPRNVIAKKIASLRKIYSTWMEKAKMEKDAKIASVFKKAALALMTVIDKLLQVMQRGANKLS
jgi:hypothetical protein